MEKRIIDHLNRPQEIPLRKLVELTRDYHAWSNRSENPNSPYHRWYYRLASECERRGLNLGKIIRKDI